MNNRVDRPKIVVTGIHSVAMGHLLEGGGCDIPGVVVEKSRNRTRFNTSITFRDGVPVAHVWKTIRDEFPVLGFEVPRIDYFRLQAKDTGIHEEDSQIVCGAKGEPLTSNKDGRVLRRNEKGPVTYVDYKYFVIVKANLPHQKLRWWMVSLKRHDENVPEVEVVLDGCEIGFPGLFQNLVSDTEASPPTIEELAQAVQDHLDFLVKQAVQRCKEASHDKKLSAQKDKEDMEATREKMMPFCIALALAFFNLFAKEKMSMLDLPRKENSAPQKQTAPEQTAPEQTGAEIIPIFPELPAVDDDAPIPMDGAAGGTLCFATEGEMTPADKGINNAPAPTTNFGSVLEAARRLQEGKSS